MGRVRVGRDGGGTRRYEHWLVQAARGGEVEEQKRTGESIRSHLTRTFKFHDGAEDGWLTIAEFRRALETLGLPLDVRQATLFFRQFPCRGGGPGEPAERVEWASFVAQVVKDGADGDVGL
jgi:hypothetical protein